MELYRRDWDFNLGPLLQWLEVGCNTEWSLVSWLEVHVYVLIEKFIECLDMGVKILERTLDFW